MKNRTTQYSGFLLLALIVISISAFSQYPSTEEGYNYPTKTNATYPPIKVLIVPVEMVDASGAFCSPIGDPCFPAGGIPTDIDKYFDSAPTTNPTGYITKYYYDASLGNLLVLGDYLTQSVKIPCGTNSTNIQTAANRAMFDQFGLTLPLAHSSALSDFDKYSLEGTQVFGYPKDPTPNYRFDHVIYLCRDVPGWGSANGFGCTENTALGGEHHLSYDNFPNPSFGTTGTGVNWSQDNAYHFEGTGSISSTYTDNADGALYMTKEFDVSGMVGTQLEFDHICATEGDFDFGKVEYSLNGGANWLSFPTSRYLGIGAIPASLNVIGFDKNSYPDWSSQFVNSTSTYPAAPATSLWKQEKIDISFVHTRIKIRFRLTSNSTNNFAGWKIDHMRITYVSKVGVYGPYGNDVGCAFGHDGSMHSVQFILEEFLHAIYGLNNWHSGGGASNHTFFWRTEPWGLATQTSGGGMSNVVCAWDRWLFGWKNPPDRNLLISGRDAANSEISTDISLPATPTTSTFVLRDFVTTGDAIRIKFPHINWHSIGDVKNQYLWLENHQLINSYDQNVNYTQNHTNICGPRLISDEIIIYDADVNFTGFPSGVYTLKVENTETSEYWIKRLVVQ